MNAPDSDEPARAKRLGLLFERFFGEGLGRVLDRALDSALKLHQIESLELALDNNRDSLASDLNVDLVIIGTSRCGDFFVNRALNLDFTDSVSSFVLAYSLGVETNEFLNSFANTLDLALEQALDRDLDSDIAGPGRRRRALDRACALALVLANYFRKHQFEFPRRSNSRLGRLLGLSQDFSYADFVLEYVHQQLTILKLRIDGYLSAFEGIRIMKSREP